MAGRLERLRHMGRGPGGSFSSVMYLPDPQACAQHTWNPEAPLDQVSLAGPQGTAASIAVAGDGAHIGQTFWCQHGLFLHEQIPEARRAVFHGDNGRRGQRRRARAGDLGPGTGGLEAT